MTNRISKDKLIGFKDLRENSSRYIDAVDRGQSFTVMRRSKPIFKMVPIDNSSSEDWEMVVDFENQKGHGLKTVELLKILERINK